MAANNYFVVKNGLAVENSTYTKTVINNAGQFIGDPTGVIQNSYDKANSANVLAQAAFDEANSAMAFAQDSYNAANTKLSLTGGTMTGDIDIRTANVDAKFIIVEDTLYSGLATRSATPLPNLIAQFTGNTDSYVQVNAQNIDEHGTSDYVLTTDVGSDTKFYVDLGVVNSQYNNLSPNNSLGTAVSPLDGYLYVQGSDINQIGGNLVIGVTHTGQDIKFIAGGVNSENVIAKISESDVYVYKDLVVDGSISGPTITNMQTYTQAAFDKANTGGGGGGGGTTNAFSVISTSGYPNIVANSTSNTLVIVGQTGIALATDPANSTLTIATNLIGASNVIIDYGYVSDTIGTISFNYGYVS